MCGRRREGEAPSGAEPAAVVVVANVLIAAATSKYTLTSNVRHL